VLPVKQNSCYTNNSLSLSLSLSPSQHRSQIGVLHSNVLSQFPSQEYIRRLILSHLLSATVCSTECLNIQTLSLKHWKQTDREQVVGQEKSLCLNCWGALPFSLGPVGNLIVETFVFFSLQTSLSQKRSNYCSRTMSVSWGTVL